MGLSQGLAMSATETSSASCSQPGILNSLPELGCYLLLNVQEQTPQDHALSAIRSTSLCKPIMDGALIVGLGARLMQGADSAIGYKAYDASHHLSPPCLKIKPTSLFGCAEKIGAVAALVAQCH